MKPCPPGVPRPRTASPSRIPAFYAVPARARHDAWTPLRQAEFIGQLAETRSVAEAARRVGMARETAYRLRRRKWSESFVAAWDAALGRPVWPYAPESLTKPLGKVTYAELEWRLESGLWRVVLRHGLYRGVRRKPDNSALLALVRRAGFGSRRGTAGAALRARDVF